MSKQSYLFAVIEAINSVTGSQYTLDEVPAATNVFELGVDSLNVVELIMSLELALDISIPFEDLAEETFQSLAHLADFLEGLHMRQSGKVAVG